MNKNMIIASLEARVNEVIQYIRDENDKSYNKNIFDLQSWVNFHEDNIRLLLQELDEIKKDIHNWNSNLMTRINEENHMS